MKTLSAMMTPVAAANALPQGSGLRIRIRITESDAAKIGLSEKWQAALQRRLKNAERKNRAAKSLQEVFARLLLFAQTQTEPWSQRKLAAEIKIPERTLRRIRDQKVDPSVWLPRLQSAISNLNGL